MRTPVPLSSTGTFVCLGGDQMANLLPDDTLPPRIATVMAGPNVSGEPPAHYFFALPDWNLSADDVERMVGYARAASGRPVVLLTMSFQRRRQMLVLMELLRKRGEALCLDIDGVEINATREIPPDAFIVEVA